MKTLALILFSSLSFYCNASVECLKTVDPTEIEPCIERVYAEAVIRLDEYPLSSLEKELPNAHPSSYWFYVLGLMFDGQIERSAFWYYAGLLRYEFYGRANPGLEISGERELFVSMNNMILKTEIFQAVIYSPKSIDIIDQVLRWDLQTENGYTSKKRYKEELEQSRQSLAYQKEILMMSVELKDSDVVGL